MATIKTMNNISKKGLSLFGSFYQVSDSVENPDAILVRSAQVDTDNFDGLLAVARAGAGVNNITIDKASAKGICVFNTPGANANAVAELVMTVLGMAVRNVDKAAAWVKNLDTTDPDLAKTVESGKKKFAGMELAGKTLGVIGLGKIGVLVANYARWKNMRVIAYEPYPNAANMHELSNKVEIADLDTVIAKSVFLTVHVPFIKGVTENLLNRKNLAGFKGSYIMNFARGGIVEMAPVNEMLASGSLQGYLCDFPDADLIKNDKVTCFPHLGATTPEAEEKCAVMAAREIVDYLRNGNIRNSVNLPNATLDRLGKSRLCLIHRNQPGMLNRFLEIIAAGNVNVEHMLNKARGEIAYTIFDTTERLDKTAAEEMRAIPGVTRVRLLG